jgi:hypothetical protein
MMKPTTVKVLIALHEALAFHEAFRRLGYPPGDIWVAVHGSESLKGAVVPWVVLRSPLLPAPINMMCAIEAFTLAEQKDFIDLWPGCATHWNTTMKDEERVRIWRSSYVANNTGPFITKMMELGHRAPIATGVLA